MLHEDLYVPLVILHLYLSLCHFSSGDLVNLHMGFWISLWEATRTLVRVPLSRRRK